MWIKIFCDSWVWFADFSTISASPILAQMVNENAIYLDRCPQTFSEVMDFLRYCIVPNDPTPKFFIDIVYFGLDKKLIVHYPSLAKKMYLTTIASHT